MMPTTNYAAMLSQAMEAGRKRDYRRAADLLARIVGSTDEFPQAQLYLGRAYHALGEFANAAQVLGFYVRSHPRSLSGLFFLGRAYLGMEEYGLAVRHLKRAVEQDPRFSPAYGLLGLACLKARRPDKAIWWFARALEVDPQQHASAGRLPQYRPRPRHPPVLPRGAGRRRASFQRGARAAAGEHPPPPLPGVDLPRAGQREPRAVPPGRRLPDLAAGSVPAPAEGRGAPLPGGQGSGCRRDQGRHDTAEVQRRARRHTRRDPAFHHREPLPGRALPGGGLLRRPAAPGRLQRPADARAGGGGVPQPRRHGQGAEPLPAGDRGRQEVTGAALRPPRGALGDAASTTASCTKPRGSCRGTARTARDTTSTASPSRGPARQSSRSWPSSRSRSRSAGPEPGADGGAGCRVRARRASPSWPRAGTRGR